MSFLYFNNFINCNLIFINIFRNFLNIIYYYYKIKMTCRNFLNNINYYKIIKLFNCFKFYNFINPYNLIFINIFIIINF